ncbi:MAG: hypothetical protein IPJ88_14365 [Myxococcales bacterium]|nr:MAG: hypothetical protein IPJ88_14365 [Myxococcales bacterium]
MLPLWWFNIGAKRLRYSTIGIFQYLAPTCQFLLAALVFKEALSPAKLLTFIFIWLALFLYAYDTRSAYLLEQQNQKTH